MGNSLPESYLDVNELKHLKPLFDMRDEGLARYKKDVKNKMKPNWLQIQIATHSLSQYWIMWIDKDMLNTNNKRYYEIKKLCTGGFDIMPFETWA